MKFPSPALFVLGSVWILGAIGFCVTTFADPATGGAKVVDADSVRFFESRIRPLLISRCYECHAGESREGGLSLDRSDSLAIGGDSGPAVVSGDVEASLLVAAIRYDELEMPPDAPLSEKERSDVEAWIRGGAVWPVKDKAAATNPVDEDATDMAAELDAELGNWWAAKPIDPETPPDNIAGIHSPTIIDRYVDQGLDAVQLHRAPVADRTKLIRRLSYDLLGVPPSPEAIDRFAADRRSDAYTRLVDSYFADPAYGTRMARLWLDLVRYAESDGWRADAYRPQVWRYRDFVVDAFNEKMPYDRFVSLQLAGDEVSPGDNRTLAATGFLRLGIFEYNQRDAEGQWHNIVDEMTDVTADVFLATGLACAKCHDHKFDPIPRADYFRFRSVFEPVSFRDVNTVPRDADAEAEIATLLAELVDVEGGDIRALKDSHADRFPLEVQSAYRKPVDQRNTYEHQLAYIVARQVIEEGLQDGKIRKALGEERYQRRTAILKQLDRWGADPYSLDAMLTVADASGSIRPTRLPGRSQGRSFEPGVPLVLGGGALDATPPTESPGSSGRRSALATWITSPGNPIAARVMVNRLWQFHFGSGLVRSPNDFGILGERPTHPQLLDYLAQRFIESGWSIERIQREIVMTASYRQSAVHHDAAAAKTVDADNRLLWHRTVRRLDAEQYRDSLLVAMDGLIDTGGGPGPSDHAGRRSIYIRRFRNSSDEMLAALDVPPGVVGTARRDVTTTAPQSLMMLNSPRVLGAAGRVAERVRGELQGEVRVVAPEVFGAAFVDRVHRILTGAKASDELKSSLGKLAASGSEGQTDVCHILINSNAFLFVE
ncbi:Planctomycete cytochrome C [Rubripirellula tenax]|uniref:Planctomycete cytochrome C n=1 Tax=Rubripirellula tenax TaxID=2528015 RepID=A0A5C6F5W5_9BACT|nr:PSD1 and planctomycete cytochrome C domain-containing protein [Rubripirellula tenax]TWU56382.1 Planctomycete cytochrome C [Rubripirellula tenax]